MPKLDTDQIKRLILISLFSEDRLVNKLVLKGGNALSLVHNIKARASFDLDFSMEGEFDPGELIGLTARIEFRLAQTLGPAGYSVFDVKLEPRPESLTPDLKDFWGGYDLEFKIIGIERFRELGGDLSRIRREAIPARPGGRARFEIDISKHEYCDGKTAVEIDEFTIYVYTPLMIVCEKIRAICQQIPSYVQFVKKHRAHRARDFFDIYETTQRCKLDLVARESLHLLSGMFGAKRVPIRLLRSIDGEREFHRLDWNAVKDTVSTDTRLKTYDAYFDFVVEACHRIASHFES